MTDEDLLKDLERTKQAWLPFGETKRKLDGLLNQMMRASTRAEAERIAQERYRLAVEAGVPEDLLFALREEHDWISFLSK